MHCVATSTCISVFIGMHETVKLYSGFRRRGSEIGVASSLFAYFVGFEAAVREQRDSSKGDRGAGRVNAFVCKFMNI